MPPNSTTSEPGFALSAWRAVKPFANGGGSGMLAICVMQPVDVVKTRLQVRGRLNPKGPKGPKP